MTTITIDRATVEQALEAMLNFPDDISDAMFESITALKAALAQKHDPVAHSGWVLREVLFDNGEPIGHREPQHSPAALAQQAEPLNLSDPAVQKRLASQWGYVPAAAQAEPVAWRYKPMIGSSWSLSDDGYYISCKRDKGYTVEPLYTAPPQRKPLTEEEIKTAFHAARNAKLGASQDNSRHRLSVIEIARAVEKASWEKQHGQA